MKPLAPYLANDNATPDQRPGSPYRGAAQGHHGLDAPADLVVDALAVNRLVTIAPTGGKVTIE